MSVIVIANRFATLEVDKSPEMDPLEFSEMAAAVNAAKKTPSTKDAKPASK